MLVPKTTSIASGLASANLGWGKLWFLPAWLVGSLCLLTTVGCRGCVSPVKEQLSREELEKRAKEKKEAVQTSPLLSIPGDYEIKTIFAKPGHWLQTERQVKANREDLQVFATGDVLRGENGLLNLTGSNDVIEFSRPTILPKGQNKTLELQYYIPTTNISNEGLSPVSTALRLRSNLLARSLLTPIAQEPFVVNEVRHPEFLLVVVTPNPSDYSYLSATDLALWRGNELMLDERLRSYHVLLSESKEGKIALPSSLLSMTSMAVLFWDDVSPDDLSADQKTALIDWVHWGGQLIVSGPSSWSRLQNSFLMPYLPVQAVSAVELQPQDFEPLQHWMSVDVTGLANDPLDFEGPPIPGLELQLARGSTWLPQSGHLVAERAVGRGRIVMAAFPLREQRLVRWKYFASFLSSGLLRRPARTLIRGNNGFVQTWNDDLVGMERDPRLNSQVRFVSRDTPLTQATLRAAPDFAALGQQEIELRASLPTGKSDAPTVPLKPRSFYYSDPLRHSANEGELLLWSANGAAWTDTSGFAFQALTALRQAAGIVLPDRWTMIGLIGAYLLVLVPLNWCFFRALGRLELAWVAAPILAILGVIVVTRVARLDIGFARRTTEIGLMELQGEYPRAHVTNYTALYTSLSTNYSLEFPERGSVALPLGDPSRSQARLGSSTQKIQARYGGSPGMGLDPVTVFSNSTQIIHSEQMVPLAGGLLYQPDPSDSNQAALKNTTGIHFKGCCLVRRLNEKRLQIAWIGDLPNDVATSVKYINADLSDPWTHWNQTTVTRHERAGSQVEATAGDNPILVGGVLYELLQAVPLVVGQSRLLGYTDDRLAQTTIVPDGDQTDWRTVVIAHLEPAQWSPISPDHRIISRVPGMFEPSESEPQP